MISQRLAPHHSGQSGRNPLIVTSISDIVQSKDLLKENRYYGELLRLRDRQTNFQRFMVVKKAYLPQYTVNPRVLTRSSKGAPKIRSSLTHHAKNS